MDVKSSQPLHISTTGLYCFKKMVGNDMLMMRGDFQRQPLWRDHDPHQYRIENSHHFQHLLCVWYNLFIFIYFNFFDSSWRKLSVLISQNEWVTFGRKLSESSPDLATNCWSWYERDNHGPLFGRSSIQLTGKKTISLD